MREINHRAKNMLSLVQAIARQTATREPEDFIVCFTDRIQALAANQDPSFTFLGFTHVWGRSRVSCQSRSEESVFAASVEHFFDSIGGHAPSCKRQRAQLFDPRALASSSDRDESRADGSSLHFQATLACSARASNSKVGWGAVLFDFLGLEQFRGIVKVVRASRRADQEGKTR
jgi:hypothetical protein